MQCGAAVSQRACLGGSLWICSGSVHKNNSLSWRAYQKSHLFVQWLDSRSWDAFRIGRAGYNAWDYLKATRRAMLAAVLMRVPKARSRAVVHVDSCEFLYKESELS